MGKPKPMPRSSRSALTAKSRTATIGGAKAGNGSKNRDPAKWLHHSLKTIHKALKQAKIFEIRKITRRLSEARKDTVDTSKLSGPNAISKLEQQLQAAKQADLDKLAHQAAAKAGLVASDNSNSLSIAAAAAELNDGTLAPAVHQRLISASCVQKQISEQLNEFKRRFGELHHHHQQQQRHQHPAAAAAAADADVEAAADSNAEGKTPMAALEPGRKRQKIALTAATTSKPVNGHVRRVADPRSSDDSGVMAADADVRSVSDGDSFDSEALDEAEIDDEGSSGSSSIDLEAEYEAQLRQIDVDQPDQPTRAAQLDDATLAALDKLHNRSTAAAAAAEEEDRDSGSEDSGLITDTAGASMSDTDSDQQQQVDQQGNQHDSKQQQQQQQQGDGVKYPPPPQLSKAEKMQLKKRQKLEKLLKSGKRLGQRMRRRLYEKLYGQDANHLKVHSQQRRRTLCTNRMQPVAGDHAGNASRGGIGKERQQQRAANAQQYQQRDSRTLDRIEQQKRPQDLHPSWAARKHQKQISGLVTAAASKKMVFGDDGETVTAVHPPAQRQLHNKPSQKELPVIHQQLPHKQHDQSHHQPQQQGQLSVGQQPSKSKQRHGSALQPSGGVTRIVLSSRNLEKAADKLHPSWQAKKQQQIVIAAQPTGKKTTFEDD